jgi:hypothetical protein
MHLLQTAPTPVDLYSPHSLDFPRPILYRFSPATSWPPQTLPQPLSIYSLVPTLPPPKLINIWEFSTRSYFCSHLLTLVLRSRIFLPWRERRHDSPRRRFNPLHLHGATLQKTAFFKFYLVAMHFNAAFSFGLTAVRSLSTIPGFPPNSWPEFSAPCCNTTKSLIGAE